MFERAEQAPLIAIIGCDGSGKSTVCAHVLALMRGYGPATMAHLGKQSGNVGRTLERIPLLGPRIGRLISDKEKSVRKQRNADSTPGVLSALVIFAFSLRRTLRFRRMLKLRRRGMIVVADRYPQMELQGTYDCPGLSVSAQGNRFVNWMARREHTAFVWMTRYRPDLVLRLNVDLEVALTRKPDHRRDNLERKIAATPLLTFNGAHIVDIDANQVLPDVLSAATAAVSNLMVERSPKTGES